MSAEFLCLRGVKFSRTFMANFLVALGFTAKPPHQQGQRQATPAGYGSELATNGTFRRTAYATSCCQ